MKITIENGDKKVVTERLLNCKKCWFRKSDRSGSESVEVCTLFEEKLTHDYKQCDQCKKELGEMK